MKPVLFRFITVPSFISALLLAAAVYPSEVCAHAVLSGSSPQDSAVLATPPREAVLRFTARIERRVSRISLVDAAGRRVKLRASTGDRDAAASNQLIIPLPPLGPGDYRIEYLILATDGHATPGMIRFTIKGPGAK